MASVFLLLVLSIEMVWLNVVCHDVISWIWYAILDPLNPHDNYVVLIHVSNWKRKKKEWEEQFDGSYLLDLNS